MTNLCEPICGDGLLRGNETCDDGINDEEGCSADCLSVRDNHECNQTDTETPASCCSYKTGSSLDPCINELEASIIQTE